MTAVLLTPLTGQFFDNNGNPLSGGLIYSYQAGTTTPQATYTDASGLTPATNPVVCNSAGRADIWGSGVYKFVITDALGNTIDTLDNVTAIYGAGDMTKAVYDPANIAQQVVGTTAVQTITNKTLTRPIIGGEILLAGTASVPPVTYTAGINLTTAAAGSVEYDGTRIFSTPLGTQRGLVENGQLLVVQNVGSAGSNTSSVQAFFGLGVTLTASTLYAFEANYFLSKSAGTTAHTIALAFGGTATYTSVGYSVISTTNSTSFTTASTVNELFATVANTSGALTASISTANAFQIIKCKGYLAINAGGTVIPSYQTSAAPGGAYTLGLGTDFKIWPVGTSGLTVEIGNWA